MLSFPGYRSFFLRTYQQINLAQGIVVQAEEDIKYDIKVLHLICIEMQSRHDDMFFGLKEGQYSNSNQIGISD